MFEYTYRVSFSDCDPAGVIFYAEAFNIVHRAYEEFLLSTNDKNYFNDKYIALPILQAEVEYYSPIRLHESLIVKLLVKEIRESSFSISYSLEDEEGNRKASVKTVHVVIDKSTGKKTKLPEDLKNYLSANLFSD